MEIFFPIDGRSLFDEKIFRSGAKAVFLTLVAHPKPTSSSRHKMYGFHIFWRPVCRTRGRLAQIQAVLQRIRELHRGVCNKWLITLSSNLKI
jgi:hypothetical protein